MRVVVVVLISLLLAMVQAKPIVKLASLYWPPYSGANLEQQGVSVAIAKAAFAEQGYKLEVDFFPWSRAVMTARQTQSEYLGYFPEYYSPRILDEFLLSDSIGVGPLGFVESTNAPVLWGVIDDLSNKRIGVVQDYLNTEAFDEMVANGRLRVESVTQDRLNVLKVAGGRLDLAVIDENLFNFLVATDEGVIRVKDIVQFNQKKLADKDLFIAFSREKSAQQWVHIFNQGLAAIDKELITAQYLKEMKEGLSPSRFILP